MTLGDRLFQDKVEWAIALPQNLPERYAASVCSELGLDWQHARAIAGALREQISLHLQVSGLLQCCFPVCEVLWLLELFPCFALHRW